VVQLDVFAQVGDRRKLLIVFPTLEPAFSCVKQHPLSKSFIHSLLPCTTTVCCQQFPEQVLVDKCQRNLAPRPISRWALSAGRSSHWQNCHPDRKWSEANVYLYSTSPRSASNALPLPVSRRWSLQASSTARHQRTLRDHGYGPVYHAICLFTSQAFAGYSFQSNHKGRAQAE